MMLDAMTALLSLPRVTSHRFSRSRMTVTRKLRGAGAARGVGRWVGERGRGRGVAGGMMWVPHSEVLQVAAATIPRGSSRHSAPGRPSPVLLILHHAAADAANGPAQPVERRPAQLPPVELRLQGRAGDARGRQAVGKEAQGASAARQGPPPARLPRPAASPCQHAASPHPSPHLQAQLLQHLLLPNHPASTPRQYSHSPPAGAASPASAARCRRGPGGSGRRASRACSCTAPARLRGAGEAGVPQRGEGVGRATSVGCHISRAEWAMPVAVSTGSDASHALGRCGASSAGPAAAPAQARRGPAPRAERRRNQASRSRQACGWGLAGACNSALPDLLPHSNWMWQRAPHHQFPALRQDDPSSPRACSTAGRHTRPACGAQ